MWYELCGNVNRNKVTNEKTLIAEIQAGTKKIRPLVVRRSIAC